MNKRPIFLFGLCLLLFALFLGACRPVDPSLELGMSESNGPTPEKEQDSGQSSSSSPSAVPAETSASSLDETVPALDLFILHTNDTWGYYDPCG